MGQRAKYPELLQSRFCVTLKNLEDRKGRPARLVLGDPMLDEIDVLPSPEILYAELLRRCSVDAGGTSPGPGHSARPGAQAVDPEVIDPADDLATGGVTGRKPDHAGWEESL